MQIIVMETKFNFNSQVCTDKIQSERLLSLGLKKETADMALIENWEYDLKDGKFFTGEYFERPIDYVEGMTGHYIPAWSLHRLIEMIKDGAIRKDGTDEDLSLDISGDDLYDGTIEAIEWLIKEGYFNKEYLNGND